jgi:hypothetical protein
MKVQRQRSFKKQRGFLAPVVFGAILVFSTLSWILVQQQIANTRDDSANQAGVYAAQFKHALQSKLTQDGVGITTGTFIGTAWLKDSATCTSGTGTMQHLPCTFPDTIAFGLSYSTTVSVAAGIVTLQTSLGAPVYRGDVKPSISGRIVAAINGANSAYSTPVTQVYFVANHDLVTGAITMTVTNSQNLDYLKPDGSVLPTANFDWNNYDINNVGTLSADTINADNISANTQRNNTTETTSLIMRGFVGVGSSCSGRQINVDASGNIVSCVGGVWISPASSPTTYAYNYSVVNNGTYYMQAGASGKIIIRGTVHGRAGYASFGLQWLRLYVDNVERQLVYSSNMEYDNRRSGVGMTVHYVLNTTPFRNVPIRLYRAGALEYGTMFLSGLGL